MNIRITVCIFLAVIMSMPTYAQQGVLEEIVVTARRLEENVQEVPISISAFSGIQLGNIRSTRCQQFSRAKAAEDITDGDRYEEEISAASSLG